MINRQMVIIIVLAIAVIGIFIIGLYVTLNPQNPAQEPAPISNQDDPGPQPEPHTDEIDDQFITNIEVLFSAFDDKQYIFINDSVQNFADGNYPLAAENISIDTTTFVQRDDTSWGFSIADPDGVRLFYVIATKLPDGQVKVDCYKS